VTQLPALDVHIGQRLVESARQQQAALPSSVMTAGTIVIRTTRASKSTAMPSANPIDLTIDSGETMNPRRR